jgi:hypothetical protein
MRAGILDGVVAPTQVKNGDALATSLHKLAHLQIIKLGYGSDLNKVSRDNLLSVFNCRVIGASPLRTACGPISWVAGRCLGQWASQRAAASNGSQLLTGTLAEELVTYSLDAETYDAESITHAYFQPPWPSLRRSYWVVFRSVMMRIDRLAPVYRGIC